MSDAAPEQPGSVLPEGPPRRSADELEELRELLLGPEKRQILEVRERLADPTRQAQELSEVLPPAVSLCNQRNDELAKALVPALADALKESARKNPALLVNVIIPAIGPAIGRVLTRLTAALVILNLGSLFAALYLLSKSWPSSPPAAASAQVASNSVPALATAPPEIVTVVQTNEFSWRQLESEDYKTYIARLRAIGCPEETIRDLIMADVDNLLAPRLRAVAARTNELKYWQTDEKDLWDVERRATIRKQRQDIDFEKRDIVWQLMGIDVVAERLKLQGEEDSQALRLSFLSDEKRSQVRKLLDRFGEEEMTIREKITELGGALSESDRAELQGLFKERDQEIAGLLSPAEFEQYQLWYSPPAYKVRDAFFGLEPSEEEFLAIYKLTKAFDEACDRENLDANNAATRESWLQAKGELDAGIRAQLGEERYAEFKQNQDPEFRELALAVARFNLPRDTTREVYDLKSVAQAERLKVQASERLTAEQKETALKEMAEETERTLKQLLGATAFNYYARRGQVNWIRP